MAHIDSYQATPSAGQHCCPVCIIAVVKDPMTPCSRRCQWAGNGACAQCGRWLNPEDTASPTGPLPFCGASCHSQAYHANWCVGCGVRQRGYGAQSCGGDFCEAVSPGRIAMLAQGSKPSGRNPYRRPVPAPALVDPYTAGFLTEWQGVFVDPALAAASAAAMAGAVPWGDMMMPAAASPWVGSVPAVMAQAPVRRAPPAFEVLPAHDKHRQALEGLVRPHGFSVVGVIRLVGSAAAKKSYLAYRSRVESEIGAFKEAKYGFGGEGNEQRRFTPLGTSCNGESLVKNLLAMQRGGQQGAFDPCHDAACDVCRTLRLGGARLGAMNVASHYSITSMDSALGAAATLPKPSGSDNAPIAILVSRVVVGRPVVVESVSDMGMTLPPQQHSFVVSNGNGRQDGVYVLTDDAVDACHVVFACR